MYSLISLNLKSNSFKCRSWEVISSRDWNNHSLSISFFPCLPSFYMFQCRTLHTTFKISYLFSLSPSLSLLNCNLFILFLMSSLLSYSSFLPLKQSFLFSIFCHHVSSSYQRYSHPPNIQASSSIKYFSVGGRGSQGKNSHSFVKLLWPSKRPVLDFCPLLHSENSWEREQQHKPQSCRVI